VWSLRFILLDDDFGGSGNSVEVYFVLLGCGIGGPFLPFSDLSGQGRCAAGGDDEELFVLFPSLETLPPGSSGQPYLLTDLSVGPVRYEFGRLWPPRDPECGLLDACWLALAGFPFLFCCTILRTLARSFEFLGFSSVFILFFFLFEPPFWFCGPVFFLTPLIYCLLWCA